MPAQLRKETVEHARSIARRYGAAFKADRQLKDRVLRLARPSFPEAEAPRRAAQSDRDPRDRVVPEIPPPALAREPASIMESSLPVGDSRMEHKV